jgi:hypothetical protein
MNELKVNFGTETRLFMANGDVAIITDGQPRVRGRWRSQSLNDDPKDNQLRYELDGVSQDPIDLEYRFNQDNQLQATVKNQSVDGITADPVTYFGQIVVPDPEQLHYELIGEDGKLTGRTLVVYGDIAFAEDTNDLVVRLVGGGEASIKGAEQNESLEALRNTDADLLGDDLIRFNAFTKNLLAGQAKPKRYRAQIEFTGKWDLTKDGLRFAANVQRGASNKNMAIAFGGKVKAITAGFAYFSDAAGTKLAFTISGQHTWDAGSASWKLALGHSNQVFTAKFSGAVKHTFDNGNVLELSGVANVKVGGGKTAVDLSITAAYSWEKAGGKNKLVFKALVSGDDASLNYDLNLEGNFIFNGKSLVFRFRFANQSSNSNSLQFELAFSGNETSLIENLSLVLDVDRNQVDLSLKFSMEMRFVAGTYVKKLKKTKAGA